MNKYLEKVSARRFVRELVNDAVSVGFGKGKPLHEMKAGLKARTPTGKKIPSKPNLPK